MPFLAHGGGVADLNGADEAFDWLSDSYAAAAAGLTDLDFSERQLQEEVPAVEQVEAALAPVAAWLGERARLGHQHEVVIEPSVRKFGLVGTRRWPGLIPRFDILQREADQTFVWPEVWTQMGDKDPAHDIAAKGDPITPFSVAILLGDIGDPINVGGATSLYNDPGGVYGDRCADEQQQLLLAEQLAYGAAGHKVESVTIGQIIAINAARRRADQPFLSSGVVTRLLHYPTWHGSGDHKPIYTPAVRAVGQRQELGGSDIEAAQDDVVVRRVLKLDFSAQR